MNLTQELIANGGNIARTARALKRHETTLRRLVTPEVRAALQGALREQMVDALHLCSGNGTEAAKKIGVSRDTLYKRLKRDPSILIEANKRIIRDMKQRRAFVAARIPR